MDLALSIINTEREEVRNMKIATSILAGVLFIGTMGVVNTVVAADGVISKDELTTGEYCHEKFPAIRESSLGDNQPALQDSKTGDVVDFYGPCGEDPRGKDQVDDQKLIELHQMFEE
jgi:hypothetical protein